MLAGVKCILNNKYHIELIDSRTGKVKQDGDFHNMAVMPFNRLFVRNAASSNTETVVTHVDSNILYTLYVGSGTTTPEYTDISLASSLWYATATTSSKEWIDDYTAKGTAEFIFPATSSYVGTVTECGLGTSAYSIYGGVAQGVLVTRALLTDSEGQQISFVKTDLDILKIVVEVEVSISSSNIAFTILKKPYRLNSLIDTNDAYYITTVFGLPNLCRFKYDVENFIGGINPSIDKVLTSAVYGKYNASESYLRFASSRLLSSDITDETYYHAVALPGLGYWSLPNENIFPAYTIEGISLGTGDGTETTFQNPINYFKANTEKVYKNAVQLTRGTDYTIDNLSNANCLPELTQDLPAYTVLSNFKSNSSPWKDYAYQASALGRPSIISRNLPKDFDTNSDSYGFDANNPLLFEFESPVMLNCFKSVALRTLRMDNGNSTTSTLPSGTTFYVDYSLDGVEYTNAGSAATTGTTGNLTFDFTGATAKYWRVRTSFNWTGSGNEIVGIRVTSGSTLSYLTLNHKNPDIVFTTAPAAGDILTMDVDMDVIMKNSNFVVDVACRLDYTL